MDKTAIKNFSIWARNKLIADITYKAGLLGVTVEGIKDALPQSTKDAEFFDIGTKEPYAIHGEEIKQRRELVSAIRRKEAQLDYKDAYKNVIEEVAYTWFNRLIAIRFMEVNDYMSAHIRVLSSESKNKLEPDLVTTPFDAELDFSQEETEKIMQMKHDNQVDALFRFLFIKQCNALNAYLPKLFEKTSDYTELLLNVSVTDQDGIVYHLTHDIAEADFNIAEGGQIEIIGWLYQYYNLEPKNAAFAKNGKITKEEVPAVTQLFTPDWIVRYMVENSVGRLWLEGHEDNRLKDEWRYYLDEAGQDADVAEQLRAIREEYKNIKPEEIKVIDPCMGSGHILVYAFDVLMQIYESYGYSQRDAAKSIVENNIFGLDIDDRAFQLAYFAIMMKARSYNRRFLTLEIEPNLCAIQESNGLQYDKDMGDFLLSEEHRETLKYLLHTFLDAKEYGSILNVDKRDYDGFLKAWELTSEATLENLVMMLWYNECNEVVPLLSRQAKILTQSYDVVITNPPYMGSDSMSDKLSKYVKKKYSKCKADMYAVFIERCGGLLKKNGLQAMITQHSWMFLSSFEQLRKDVLDSKCLINMCHLGARAFEEISGEVVQTVAWIMRKQKLNYNAKYFRLVEPNTQKGKEEMFLRGTGLYTMYQKEFYDIPGQPVAYWISDAYKNLFKNGVKITNYVSSRDGLTTGNNDLFIKQFWEIEYSKIKFGCKDADEFWASGKKYAPLIKGGLYRKWYGNNWFVITYDIAGFSKLSLCGNKLPSREIYFRPYISWNRISTRMAFRYSEQGYIFESASLVAFSEVEENAMIALAFANTVLAKSEMAMINPTTNMLSGYVDELRLPELIDKNRCELLAKECVKASKEDWDSFETSWDFSRHPLATGNSIRCAFENWEQECKARYELVKRNEIELNSLFALASGLSNELVIDVEDKDISIRKANLADDVRTLISYAVGCIVGRYSLDEKGIVFAGGKWDSSKYRLFIPDTDNIIPITDEEYFADDIVGKLCEWVKTVYGEDTLSENLEFIATGLGGKGNSAKEVIRNYFLKEFIQYENKMYQKKPIYWLFESGKENGFKALVYMHRYNADTIGNLRVDYLHRMERIYESEINRMQDTINNSSNAREVTAATKRKEKLQKQLKECQEYDEKIGHLALSRIEIDLDDGVKVNYEKIQTANDGKRYQVMAKI